MNKNFYEEFRALCEKYELTTQCVVNLENDEVYPMSGVAVQDGCLFVGFSASGENGCPDCMEKN